MNKVAQRPSPPVSATEVGAASPSTLLTRGLTYYKAFNSAQDSKGTFLHFTVLKGVDKWAEKD